MPTKVTNSHLFTGFCISVNRAGLQQVTCHTCITSYLPVQHLWCQRAESSIVDLTASNITLKAGKNAAKIANLSGPSVKDAEAIVELQLQCGTHIIIDIKMHDPCRLYCDK